MFNGITVSLCILSLLSIPSSDYIVEASEIKDSSLLLNVTSNVGKIIGYELNQESLDTDSSILKIPLEDLTNDFYITIKSELAYTKVKITNTRNRTHLYDIEDEYDLGYYVYSLMSNCYCVNRCLDHVEFIFPNIEEYLSLLKFPRDLFGTILYQGKDIVYCDLKIYTSKLIFPHLPYEEGYLFHLDSYQNENIYTFSLETGYSYSLNGELIYDGKGDEKDIILPRKYFQGELNYEVNIGIGKNIFHFPKTIKINEDFSSSYQIEISEKEIETYEKILSI